MKMITRFAPSPTGLLHVGHAYSAIHAANMAKSTGGKFLLRIENIDQTRCKSEYEDAIFEDLAWLGLKWEDPVCRQSDRLELYKSALQKLVSQNVVYKCFCTRSEILNEINGIGHAPHLNIKKKEVARYPGTCKRLTFDEINKNIKIGKPYAIRLNIQKAIKFCPPLFWQDLKKGKQLARPEIFGDVMIARKDIPTSYHLSSTTDDHFQNINCITRGIDLFEATHIHRILQALLGYKTPIYEHHELIRDTKGARLSKRNKSLTLKSLRNAGESPRKIFKLTGLSSFQI